MNEQNNNATENEPAKQSPNRESVGDLLRTHREKAGQDILSVAGSLRISVRYLEAIEEGRNKDLPGTAYAVGFIRSYAEHLNLDEDEIVRRFKEEANELPNTSELTFPKPIPEGGVPGGVILLAGAAVALFAYGIWYVSTDSDEPIAAQVEPVPERLAEQTSNENASSPQEGSTVLSSSESEPSDSGEQDEVDEEPETISEETSTTEEVIETQTEVTQIETTEEVSAEQETAQDEVQSEIEIVTETVTEPEAAVPTPEAEPAPVSAPVASSPSSRITVRAKTNSWIQIRDEAEDKLLFTRLLRKGNEYNVPDRDGLTLLTGNAGALEILVDGQIVPPIGEAGDVRRNVTLDPAKLKSGNAVSD